MRIVVWNVNSIKMRLQHLHDLLDKIMPDIVLLQEIKCETNKFPLDEFSHLSYNIYIHGQKSYNGVAILSKFPAESIEKDFPNNYCSDQSRFIEISVQTPVGLCTIISLYAPNGSMIGSDKFDMKLKFYDKLADYLIFKKSLNNKIIVGGDFNIAPFDIDVYSPKELLNSVCFSDVEKQKMRIILNSDFEDSYRLINHDKKEFSWWDYRSGCFEQNKGMRIDMILMSSNVVDHLESCYMDYNLRTKHKPSDHIPIIATLK